MSIRLELYRIFDRAAKCRSFSQAARELFMTQPAVSQAMMQLESQLGVRLFTRTTKGVNLTNEGRVLLEFTNSALSLLDAGENKLRETKNLKTGELRIGVSDTICRYYLLPHIKEFLKNYPHIKLKIINKTTEGLCDLVKTGEIELAICNLPIEDDTLEVRKCQDIQDVFVGNAQYKDAVTEPITFENLVSYPLIFLDTWSRTRQYVERFLLSKSIKIIPEIELGSHDLLLEFAKIGLGLACVVREFSTEYLEEGSLFEIGLVEQIPKRAIGICSLRGVTWSRASRIFTVNMVP